MAPHVTSTSDKDKLLLSVLMLHQHYGNRLQEFARHDGANKRIFSLSVTSSLLTNAFSAIPGPPCRSRLRALSCCQIPYYIYHLVHRKVRRGAWMNGSASEPYGYKVSSADCLKIAGASGPVSLLYLEVSMLELIFSKLNPSSIQTSLKLCNRVLPKPCIYE